MPDFVKDDTTPPKNSAVQRRNIPPGEDPNEFLEAADWLQLNQNTKDIRAFLWKRGGKHYEAGRLVFNADGNKVVTFTTPFDTGEDDYLYSLTFASSPGAPVVNGNIQGKSLSGFTVVPPTDEYTGECTWEAWIPAVPE